MKRFSKRVFVSSLACCMFFALLCGIEVSAAKSGDWNIDYKKGAPTSVSNQISTVVLNYYSGGYKGCCYTLTGTSGKYIVVSSTSAGGMTPITVKSVQNLSKWKMKSSTSGTVTFRITAYSTGYCKSTGNIRIAY